ncbi:Unknown protein [Striga hermonthica]|uniref:Malonyl-CoA:ACP transacylase (MAT) domain-containing protein n=1 Tax=Striga hermonthica TaxID=68872 RepID=A0A9N7P463_STRHE|nr:Unknown protein [Striga hermonthica]
MGVEAQKVPSARESQRHFGDTADATKSAMVSIIGLDSANKVQQLCDAVHFYVANFRCTVRLAVTGAFHTGFMEPAVSRLEAAFASTVIKTSRIPVISNVDAEPHADPATINSARSIFSDIEIYFV